MERFEIMSKYKVGEEMIEIDEGMKAEAKMMQETLREVKEQYKINNTLQVKYIDKNITPMKKIDGGDLVDIRVSRVFDCKYNYQTKKLEMTEKEFPYQYNQGDTIFFKLGFAMKMPPRKKLTFILEVECLKTMGSY